MVGGDCEGSRGVGGSAAGVADSASSRQGLQWHTGTLRVRICFGLAIANASLGRTDRI
jgi:hypothetical protein